MNADYGAPGPMLGRPQDVAFQMAKALRDLAETASSYKGNNPLEAEVQALGKDAAALALRLLDGEQIDGSECLGPEGDCNETHVPPCPLAHG